MYMDGTTEAIAHFIGLFATTVEDQRQREIFEEFIASKAAPLDADELASLALPFSAPYKLTDYEPGFSYEAPVPVIEPAYALSEVKLDAPEVLVEGDPSRTDYPEFSATGLLPAPGGDTIVPPESEDGSEPEPESDSPSETFSLDTEILGSVANYITQTIALSDNDDFSAGGHELQFSPTPVGDAELIALAEEASEVSPFFGIEMPGTTAELKAFAGVVAEAIEEYQQSGSTPETPTSTPGTTEFVETAPSIEGTYVNGVEVDEAPDIDDYFSLDEKLEEAPHVDEPLEPNTTLTEDGYVVDASVMVDTGSNALVNDATLESYWTAATVTAVVGDHYEINAIVQVNAWSDSDSVTSAVENWIAEAGDTETFNIATFERDDATSKDDESEQADDDADAEPSFPEYWSIEKVTGDLVIVNWLEQLIVMTDNDIGVLSSSGATSFVYAGDNIDYNGVALEEYGFSYDLIIIAGNEYDISIIEQLNVLYDNDLIGAVSGFESTGEGSYSTSDNLLWNGAYIYNYGSADRFETLTDDYKDAADSLASGALTLNSGVLTDGAFAGYQSLNVLYVSGDLINIQYVKQTNILSDSDQLALAMDATDAYPDAQWSVTTGDNVLINNATIVDLDSFGTTMVGGEQYSHDILIQADIISTDAEFFAQDPDALVNEAIAFLGDDAADDDASDYGGSLGGLDPDNAQGDALQTLIG